MWKYGACGRIHESQGRTWACTAMWFLSKGCSGTSPRILQLSLHGPSHFLLLNFPTRGFHTEIARQSCLPRKSDTFLHKQNFSLFSLREQQEKKKLQIWPWGLSVDTQEDFLALRVRPWNALVSRSLGSPSPELSEMGVDCSLLRMPGIQSCQDAGDWT